jgi:hypothetical protein
MKNNMFLNGPKFEQIRAFTQFQVMNDGKAPEELLYSWEEAERKLLNSTRGVTIQLGRSRKKTPKKHKPRALRVPGLFNAL